MKLNELKLELTQQCPLACMHCSTESHRQKSSALSEQTILRLLREAAQLGAKKVAFSGGEPLLVPFLPNLISQAATVGIQSTVYTCGAADFELTPLSVPSAMKLGKSGLRRLIFSIYSADPDMHNSITKYRSFSTTVLALQNALEAGVSAEIHFVAMNRNFRDLLALVDEAARWGVKRVSVLRFVPHGRGKSIAEQEDLTVDEMHELGELILVARQTHTQVEVRAGSPYNILGIGHTPCDAAQDVLVVNHRGEIFPCDAFKNVSVPDQEFGSVLSRSLREVWEQSKYLNLVRSELAAGPGVTCGSCEEFSGCKSGCLAQKVIRDGWGTSADPDPACLVQIAGVQSVNSTFPLRQAPQLAGAQSH
jgi:radical SAM protein with 4Fe4S-binding SPASM domain